MHFIHPARRRLSQMMACAVPKRDQMEGRQAGSPTSFYNRSVYGECCSGTNVRALSSFHLL